MRSLDLKLFALLDALSSGERADLAEALEPLELPPGTTVFAEGEAANGMLLLAEGRLGLRSSRAEGVAEFGPGSVLGALSLVEGGARAATAETLSRCRLWLLRRDAFERFSEVAPRAACRLLKAMLRENAALLRALAQPADAPVDCATSSD